MEDGMTEPQPLPTIFRAPVEPAAEFAFWHFDALYATWPSAALETRRLALIGELAAIDHNLTGRRDTAAAGGG
jgi:hypothetical protein